MRTASLVAIAALALAGLGGSCDGQIDETTPALCSDGVDNDGDGLVDCADPECSSAPNCANRCGDGVVAADERCDTAIAAGQVGACPTSCSDGNACTADSLLDGGTCAARCSFTPITACAGGDGCCPAGCDAASDSDCSTICGNGSVDANEVCDTKIAAGQPGACPASCDDGNACTIDSLLNAGTCSAVCMHSTIVQCAGGDGCCPSGCNATTDNDCSASCGDGVVGGNETCDTKIAAGQAGACPAGCGDGNACTIDSLLNAGTCSAVCMHSTIVQCAGGDGCCPSGCNATTDKDCSATCGNGTVEPGETCDTKIAAGQAGACPASCDDGSACTVDTLLGAGGCGASCTHAAITQCKGGDGCCPSGCNAANDGDCSPTCGNGVVEPAEKCDTKIAVGQTGACPTSCNDGNTCTIDTLTGAGGCGASCTSSPIVQCKGGDGCCPSGCNAANDGDCSPTCGNGVVEPAEKCDTKIAAGQTGACPTSCNDGNACTVDTLVGAGGCDASCAFSTITQCKGGDGCCPPSCNAALDSDCKAVCGNGVLEPGESCDTKIAAGQTGACPASCAACGGTSKCDGTCSVPVSSSYGKSCGSCGGTVKCDGSCSVATPSNYGAACGSCGGTIKCNGTCSVATPSSYGAACGSCGGTIKCDGTCSVATPSNYGAACGSCGGTIKCDGTCSVATPSNYGAACGSCGGTIKCDGSCSVATPSSYGAACGSCGGTIKCDGTCSVATPSSYGAACGSCGGTIKCDGTCSVATPSSYGAACGSCGGTIKCDGTCSVATPPNYGETCQTCTCGSSSYKAGSIDCDGSCLKETCDPCCGKVWC